MSAINDSSPVKRNVDFRTASTIFLLGAAVLFLASVAVQQQASIQRWEVLAGSLSGDGPEYDPREQLIATARLHGVANGLKVLGTLSMAAGMLALPRASKNRKAVIAGSVAAALAALSFAVLALLAVGQGRTGIQAVEAESSFPSRMLLLLGLLGLVAAAFWWRGSSMPVMAVCLFLLGSTVLGGFVANVFITPLLAGHRWSETIGWTGILVMASTAAAGISMLFAVGKVVLRSRSAG